MKKLLAATALAALAATGAVAKGQVGTPKSINVTSVQVITEIDHANQTSTLQFHQQWDGVLTGYESFADYYQTQEAQGCYGNGIQSICTETLVELPNGIEVRQTVWTWENN